MSIGLWAFLIFNLVVALDYVLIGLYVAPRFELRQRLAGAIVAQAAAVVFFVACAYTHVMIAYHAYDSHPEFYEQFHMIMDHLIQGVAGLLFFALAGKFLDIHISEPGFDKHTPDPGR